MKRRVKSEEELRKLFVKSEYNKLGESYTTEDNVVFVDSMWVTCGEELDLKESDIPNYTYMQVYGNQYFMEEWLEPLKEIKISDKPLKELQEVKTENPVHKSIIKDILENRPTEETDFSVASIAKDRLGPGKETEFADKHYDYKYHLTPEDIERGYIRPDPYWISEQWKLGEKDNTGCLFHILKSFPRWGEKNPVEREIKAVKATILRKEELYNNQKQYEERA